ncbi:shikimate dehydrogenase family protein [Cohnella terricola]|uniref:Shikimate dehydrogenase n=1 Tax=Cohnella terricola TaxID=1289167 RepID=A0A559J8N7_9BACL|nr:shikimate dehydrogenase [Cohnella terricola]TVX96255.1 shikimate dehydrogenase [Cohnella terricola]
MRKIMEKAIQPTFYFIGVTTGQSAIMDIFPRWAEALGLEKAVIKGIDIELDSAPEIYREVVQFIKNDELSLGALVTTHKLKVYEAAHDLFDYLDPYAKAFGEMSSISKRDGRLEGYAKDPISSGLAMEDFIPNQYWSRHHGEAFIMGAGGSAIAIASYLIKEIHGANKPSKIFVSDRNRERLNHMSQMIGAINHANVAFEYRLAENEGDNDLILSGLRPHSLAINATGLGKDRPGSPVTKAAVFPLDCLVWELNYRGDLLFMEQAQQQKEERNLRIHDGWIYFIHGWTQVIAEVFHISIDPKKIIRLSEIALK